MAFSMGQLKDRKLVRWALGYLATAWVLLQVLVVLNDMYAWPPAILRAYPVLAGVGLVAVLVLVWYHGERGLQRASVGELLILAGLLPLGAGLVWLVAAGSPAGEPVGEPVEQAPRATAKSIAVLPFENLSAQKENEYLATGLQDEILMHLAKVGDLRVISRTSMLGYAGTRKPTRQIGRELGVATVLAGSLQRMGDRVRVIAQLTDARTDHEVWADRYDEEATDLFALQSRIAEAIATALRAQLTASERAGITTPPTRNTAAYDLYLRAWQHLMDSGVEAEVRAAESLYRGAVELDPEFALAHARLARIHAWMFQSGFDTTAARREQARTEAETALRLQPDLSEAHLAMGWYRYRVHRDYDRALAEFEIARRGLPNDAGVESAMAAVYRRRGRWEESMAAHQRVEELDPRNVAELADLARTYAWLRRFPDAARANDRALAIAPDDGYGKLQKAELFIRWRGTTDSLAAALRPLPAGEGRPFRVELARLRHRPADVVALLRDSPGEVFTTFRGGLNEHYVPGALLLADACARLGDAPCARARYEEARTLLEKAARERPDDDRVHAALGQAYAGLGREGDALREIERVRELMPLSRDALQGAARMQDLARIYARLGDRDAALRELTQLLRVPAGLTIPQLRLDPAWDPLRADPRFQRLLSEAPAPGR